jgi:Protein of unknown function (DUF1214)
VPRGFTWSPGRVRPFPPRRRSAQRGLSFSLQHARNAEYEKEEFAFVSPYFASLRRGSFLETSQLLRSINGFNDVATNQDGSIDIWFGPEKPAEAPETNWIQTVDGPDFLVALRLYGTGVEFYDQTWKPDDVVKVN